MERVVTVTYFAIDGTEFESERECVEYEEALSKRRKHFKAYDENFNELCGDLDGTVFIHIVDEEGYHMWNKDHPFDQVFGVGMFYWDKEECEFFNIEGAIYELETRLEKLENAYKIMCAKADD